MSAPSEAEDRVPVWHYDGLTAVRRTPDLVREGEEFTLQGDGADPGPYAFADLVSGGKGQYGLPKRQGWRIGFLEAPGEGIAALLPGTKRYGGVIDRIGLFPALAIFALISVGIGWGILSSPSLLVQLVPMSVEREMGGPIPVMLADAKCSTPEGDAALKAMAKRLGAKDDVEISVANVPVVNAMAVPGNRVIILRGLLDSAKSSDEVAAVLGHEVGHAEHRHVMQALIRQYGIQLLLGGYDPSAINVGQVVLSRGYTRGAEKEADDFSIQRMQAGNISTKGGADFFALLEAEEARLGPARDWMSYLGTHPLSADRKAKFLAGVKPGTTPALDAKQWQALRGICAKAKPFSFRF